jgi:glycosyltransferase involved in cell wall biosynthesis
MSAPDLSGRRILFTVNVDWFFLSHRLPVALAAREAGAEVIVAAGATGRGPAIEAAGLRFIPLPMSRQGRNPLTEPFAILAVARLYRRLRPDLVHQVAIKPVLYGSLAASLVRPRMPRVNAISGLGFAFSADKRAHWVGRVVRSLFRVALRTGRSRTIFQNHVDLDAFVAAGLIPRDRTVLIRGSGVDPERFRPSPLPEAPVVLLASRMLWEKGVGELVEAVPTIRAQVPDVRVLLVGGPDAGNPTSIDRDQLALWDAEGTIEWRGHCTDMSEVLPEASVIVLPTYYPEGLPKVLIEAGAAARPVVASDVAGCREIIENGVNGLLVPPKDPAALADAVVAVLRDPERATAMGRAGRALVESDFTEAQVVERTMALYAELLKL